MKNSMTTLLILCLIPFKSLNAQILSQEGLEKVYQFRKGNYPQGIEFIDSLIAESAWPIKDSLYNEILRERTYLKLLNKQYDSLELYIRQIADGFHTLGHYQRAFDIYFDMGIQMSQRGMFKKGIDLFSMARQYGETNNFQNMTADAIMAQGINLRRMGNPVEALQYYFDATDIFIALHDSLGMAKSYSNIGNIMRSFLDYEEALNYFQKSLEIATKYKQNRNVANLYINLAILHNQLKDSLKALEDYQKSYYYAKLSGIKTGEAATMSNLADQFYKLQHFDSAYFYYQASLIQSIASNDSLSIYLTKFDLARMQFKIAPSLAMVDSLDLLLRKIHSFGSYRWDGSKDMEMIECYLFLDEDKKASNLVKQSLEKSKNGGNLEMSIKFLQQLHTIDHRLGKFEEAYQHSIKLADLVDSAYNETKASIIGGMEAERQLLMREKERDDLEKANTIKASIISQQRIIIGASCIILLLVIALGFISYKRFQSSKWLLEEKQLNLKKELAYKNRELVNFAFEIVERTELMETVSTEISRWSKNEDKNQEKLKELTKRIKTSLNVVKKRKEFDTHVNSVYGSFIHNLNQNYPGLSNNEHRMAALIRMDLSSKEMASILGISPKSVDMNRYRMRKKLGLDADQNLATVLKSI